MKTKILTLILALFTMFVRGSDAKLGWLPLCNPSAIGIKIYYGLVSNTVPTIYNQFAFCLGSNEMIARFDGNFSNVIVIPNTVTTNYSVTNLVGGKTYFFAITAYDSNNLESDFSCEVIYTVPLDLNTNAGSWGGITNWPVYHASGARPLLSFTPYAYDINWIIPPTISTNCRVRFVTNNAVITKTTKCWVSTNYSTSTIKNYLLKSDMVIPTNWTVQATADLRTWTNCFAGSNSPVYTTVVNQGGNKFFRLKF